MMIPENFSLTCYRLTITAQERLVLPPYKGSTLRGGFGINFKRMVCFQPHVKRCTPCLLRYNCPYPYLFESFPPQDSDVLSKNRAVPRPMVIEPPRDERTDYAPGDTLAFNLVLIGRAQQFLAYFIVAFQELGRAGLGAERGRFRVTRVEAIHPLRGERALVHKEQKPEVIRMPQLPVTADEIMAYAATLPTDQITLNFRTPARLKHKGRWARSGPPFHVLVRRLLDRVSSLSYFHCGQRFETDFRDLVDRAAQVTVAHSATRWEDWSRFSGRQKQHVRMGGLVGRVTYANPKPVEGRPSTSSGQALRAYLPLLALGALVHVGKGTVFGNGGYDVVSEA